MLEEKGFRVRKRGKLKRGWYWIRVGGFRRGRRTWDVFAPQRKGGPTRKDFDWIMRGREFEERA